MELYSGYANNKRYFTWYRILMKILIWIPSFEWKISAELLSYINNMEIPQWWKKNIFITKRTLVADARNMIVEKAINEWYDYVLFIDDDQVPELTSSVMSLLETKRSIISWITKTRTWNRLPLYNRVKCDVWFTYKNVEKIDIDNGCFQKIDACWMFFMLIHIDVLKRLHNLHNGIIFENKVTYFYKWKEYLFDKPLKNIKDVFALQLSEDILFCQRAHDIWYNIFFDVRVPVIHYWNPEKIKIWYDKYFRWWNE